MKKERNIVAERLERFRKENALSQRLMGDLLGLSQQVYSNIEKGKSGKFEPEVMKKMNSLLENNLDNEQKKLISDEKGHDFTIKIVDNEIPKENLKTDERLNEILKNLVDSQSTKNQTDMSLELLLLLKEAQGNVTNLIKNNEVAVRSNEKLADGQLELINIISRMIPPSDRGDITKKALAS